VPEGAVNPHPEGKICRPGRYNHFLIDLQPLFGVLGDISPASVTFCYVDVEAMLVSGTGGGDDFGFVRPHNTPSAQSPFEISVYDGCRRDSHSVRIGHGSFMNVLLRRGILGAVLFGGAFWRMWR